jgi:DNA-binding NtrC family response regulator
MTPGPAAPGQFQTTRTTMPIEKIVVLEDDLIVQKNLEQQLRQRRYEVSCVTTLAAAQELLSRDTVDLMFVDIRLPDGEGTELLRELQDRPQKPLVVITTGFASVESAVECMRAGAFDYLIKPFSSSQIEMTLKKAEDYSRLVRVNRYLSLEENDETGHELLGRSQVMQPLRQLIRKVAPTQATVLIQGESGTGKELVARALYRLSPRVSGPFIKINCAAVPENLIESEFFGHEKGAFTGAISKREGRFELAHGGTILLDEISEISSQVQAKLLRVLQERELERVGGNRTLKVDVRVVATTNRNLEQCVERKEFRQDLFFRLNVVPIHIPPLRERKEDIPELSERFMHRFARKHGVRVQGISDTCLAVLLGHHWPGNVRELQNVLERAVILCGDGGLLEPDHLGFAPAAQLAVADAPPEFGSCAGVTAVVRPPVPVDPLQVGGIMPLAELEKRQIFAALAHTQGNRTHAARLLGISIRTLRNKLHEYNGEVSGETQAAAAAVG